MLSCNPSLKRFPASTRHVSMLLAAMTLAGCVAVPTPPLTATVPDHWSLPADAPAVSLATWWTALKEPRLDALVQEALAQNLDLARAQRLLEAQHTMARQSSSAFLPALSIQAHPAQDTGARKAYFNTGMDVTWELGLFGAQASADMSAKGELHQLQARTHAARVLVITDVVRHYVDLSVAQDQIAHLSRIDALDQQAQGLARSNLAAGLGTQHDLDDIALRRQRNRIEHSVLHARADLAARSLALLLGRAQPAQAWREATVPLVPAAFSIKEVPADLLRTRPDIQDAEAQVLSAAGQVGLARAALYPRISLAGSILYTHSLTRGTHPTNRLAPLVGPAIDIPLWDWGQRRAQAGAHEVRLQAALLHYRQRVLAGVSDVQAALVSLAAGRDRVQALQTACAVQQQQSHNSQKLATLGLEDDVQALDRRRALLVAQAELRLAQGSQTLAFATLYKALGGATPAATQQAAP